MTDAPASIGFVGAGWRSDAYFTVAQARPDLFSIDGVLCRSDATAQRVAHRWGVPSTTAEREFFARRFDYVVLCVPRDLVSDFLTLSLDAELPTLVETPLAASTEELAALYRRWATAPIQSAEQYRYQPSHAARIAVADSGLLGRVGTAEVSVAHDYHGVSLIRRILGTGFSPVSVRASAIGEPVVGTLGRAGWAPELVATTARRVRAELRFDNGTTGLYDFTGEQYFSPIRSRRLAIRGERGELCNDEVTYMRAPAHPVRQQLQRDQTGSDGDLDGLHLRGIALGDNIVYRNPLAPARLSDDEIAIGTVLTEMRRFVDSGTPFYGIDEACEDQYLAGLMQRAIETGAIERTHARPWAPSA